ncbi:MAG: NAD(P)/FAD-dependent oxidoreductase [Prevotella sp.]|nr:NAD(P)/FAD-dependent oxidoreductase [Alistipes senegalensis]MCM1358254.1 NAD(P)/FAD-dependent oxidoreductase [Prevotella sp.]MCM1473111.1 NAD(P)/FAD-dependent oxidoreductase [Muribaculaceae bacterium]
MTDIIIIGGGASGCFGAVQATRLGKSVILFEPNEKLGRKLRITGKGRCNLTNNSDVQEHMKNIPVNNRFMYSSFSAFNAYDTMNFFEALGVPLKTERGNRVFPVSDNANDIADALVHEMKKSGVKIIHKRVTGIIMENNICKGVKAGNETYYAESVLIACGGKSYQGTGSTGDGYRLAESVGHTITEIKPSLVPLVSPDRYCADMMGLSLRNVTLNLYDREKLIYSELGEMLFTHFGVSGPLVLSASSHIREMQSGRYKIFIDLKPALTPEQLDARIQRDFSENLNRDFVNGIRKLLPAKLIPVAVRLSEISPEQKVNSITKEQRHKFGELLKAFPVRISGFRPVEEAIITSGGVSVKEINPKTMESKIINGLFFAGEVIDVDAYTGGFNLQIAFSTAYSAILYM